MAKRSAAWTSPHRNGRPLRCCGCETIIYPTALFTFILVLRCTILWIVIMRPQKYIHVADRFAKRIRKGDYHVRDLPATPEKLL